MKLDEFLNSYRLKFSLINQDEDSIIAITELVEQASMKVITNIMTKIDVQEDPGQNDIGPELSTVWNFEDMVEITKSNQLGFLLGRYTEDMVPEDARNQISESCYLV